MDIFPGLLGDKELTFFSPEDYNALKGVLNDVLAKDIKTYCSSAEANADVISDINKYLGSTLESLTLHFTLQEKGLPQLIQGILPEHLLSSGVDLNELVEKLEFLEANESKLLTAIPARNKDDYKNFISSLTRVSERMKKAGTKPTYDDMVKRIEANSFIFYTPREKASETGNRLFAMRKRQWMTTLRGAQYFQRCEAEHIPYHERRKF